MTDHPRPHAANLIAGEMADYRRRRREEEAKPYSIVGRLHALAETLKVASRAEDAVNLPTDHPKWKSFCEALGEVDFLQLHARVQKLADAWQDEIDADPES